MDQSVPESSRQGTDSGECAQLAMQLSGFSENSLGLGEQRWCVLIKQNKACHSRMVSALFMFECRNNLDVP